MTVAAFIRKNALLSIIFILPFVLIAIFWNQLPAEIPIHWGINGEPDKFAPTSWGIFLLPLINIALFAFLRILPKIDPKKNFEHFTPTMDKLCLLFAVFFFFAFMHTLLYALGYHVVGTSMSLLGVLGLFLLLGNYMSKLRPNYFIGIRTPWTLESEDNWIKTHRLAGKLWVGASLLMLLLVFILGTKTTYVLLLPYALILAFTPIFYSFYLFWTTRKERVKEET